MSVYAALFAVHEQQRRKAEIDQSTSRYLQKLAAAPQGASEQLKAARQEPVWRFRYLPEFNWHDPWARTTWFDGVDGLDLKKPRPHWKQPGLGLRAA